MLRSAKIRGAMATDYVPGDPILFGLQADQVSWSEHQPYWAYGRGAILLHPGRIQGPKSPGEIGLKILLFWLKGYSKRILTGKNILKWNSNAFEKCEHEQLGGWYIKSILYTRPWRWNKIFEKLKQLLAKLGSLW